MNKKGLILVSGIFALLFLPGTIPTYIAIKTAKLRKRWASQDYIIEG